MMNGDYVQSLRHFKKWLEHNPSLSGGAAVNHLHRIGWAYWMNGLKKEGEEFFMKQIDYCNRILESGLYGNNYFNYYDLAITYAFIGERNKAYDNLRNFAKSPLFNSWNVMLIANDPLFDSIRDEPEFQKILSDVEAKYQAEHERVGQWLEENDML